MRRIGLLLVMALIVAGCMWEAAPAVPLPGVRGQPAESCLGVPPLICQQVLDDAEANASAGAFPVQVSITCTQQPCTMARGEVESIIVYSDGQTSTMGMGWEGPMPAPAP
jgi:hypothetical protein